MPTSLYLHIPFCHQICHYCDFNKVFFKNQPVDGYIESIGAELRLRREAGQLRDPLRTIFFGGGTPTALTAAQLRRLMEVVNAAVAIAPDAEWSSEANPDELTLDKLRALREGGANRLSLGVQTFDPGLLEAIGRTHGARDVERAVADARTAGFSNMSMDLMYGLPNQEMKQWRETLERALAFDLPHYSAYSLLVEPKTVFFNERARGRLPLVPEEVEADMYEALIAHMEARGLQQYEISNFAKRGYESRHNTVYWDNAEYVGVGAGAHGYVRGVRYSNRGPIRAYMNDVAQGRLPVVHAHAVTDVERMEEEMFLGLRKSAGVSTRRFERKFGRALSDVYGKEIQSLTDRGLLDSAGESVRLTKKGKFLGNEAFAAFLQS